MVQQLEERNPKELNVKHCVELCNGAAAQGIAIRALDLTGEVIVPSYTFIATAHAMHWRGITPVFADINARTDKMDPDAVRKIITPRTSGITGVHLWGRSAPVEDLKTSQTNMNLRSPSTLLTHSDAATAGRQSGGLAEPRFSASMQQGFSTSLRAAQ